MAERRMIAKRIIDSDAFLDMPLSSQALYFHLLLRADDDGFVDNCKKISRMIGSSEDDLRLLIAKRYLLVFESGVVVVKHWRIHNYIAKDRYTSTSHVDECERLEIMPSREYEFKEKSQSFPQNNPQTFPHGYPQVENELIDESCPQDNPQSFPQSFPQRSENVIHSVDGLYTDCIQDGDNVSTNCIQSDIVMSTNCSHRLDKISIDKIRLDEVSPAVDKMSTGKTDKTDEDDDETDDDKNKTADMGQVPPEPVDPETFQNWFKKESVSGSDASTSDKPIRKPTAAEDMADKVGKLFHELLPLLPYAGVPDKLVVDIARAGKSVDYYRQVFERAAKSSFLSAPEAGRTWCCSLSWLCRPDVCEQVLAGKYDDFSKGKKPFPQPEQGVTMVNGAENGFETKTFFEAAFRRSWRTAEQDPEILERMLKENNEDES